MRHRLSLLALSAFTVLFSGCSLINGLINGGENNSQSDNQSSDSGSGDSSSFVPTGDDINPENSEAQAISISSLISANKGKSNNTKLYRITGTAQWPKNTTYGNFDLVDDTGYIYVYGCSKQNTTITKNGSTYSYANNSSFSSIGIKPGDLVTMEGLFVWYAYSNSYGVSEFQGYVTKVVHQGQSEITPASYSATETYSGSYYNSIGEGDSGTELLKKLHNLMDSTHSTYLSYKALDSIYKTSDPSGSSVKCFYSGKATSSFNKEHVWPQSLSNNLYGETYAGADLHHIRPTISSYNSLRSNSMFGPVFGNKSAMSSIAYQGGGSDYCTGNVFEPADAIKGDVARIIMYVYMHYSNATGGASQSYYGDLRINWVMGTSQTDSWKLLRKWNAEDPVSSDEITRNNVAANRQGNRNPFIDHPSYADRIWG